MKHRPERVREGVDCECLAADRGCLEQGEPDKRPLEPGRVSVDDPVAVDGQADKRKVRTARRIPEELHHKIRLATIAASAGSSSARSQTFRAKTSWRAQRAGFRPDPA